MRYVREPSVDVDREAVRARLSRAMRESTTEGQASALCDIPALLAEIDQIRRVEESNRREFADLLAAARAVLAELDEREGTSLVQLGAVARLHREITDDELDAWRPWRQTTENASTEPMGHTQHTDRKEALTD